MCYRSCYDEPNAKIKNKLLSPYQEHRHNLSQNLFSTWIRSLAASISSPRSLSFQAISSYSLQAKTLREFPAPISLVTITCCNCCFISHLIRRHILRWKSCRDDTDVQWFLLCAKWKEGLAVDPELQNDPQKPLLT